MMSEPIEITVSLAMAPGSAPAVRHVVEAMTSLAGSVPGGALAARWSGAVADTSEAVDLVFTGADQAAVDAHLEQHGRLYGALDRVSRVTDARVAGTADNATIAAIQRLVVTAQAA